MKLKSSAGRLHLNAAIKQTANHRAAALNSINILRRTTSRGGVSNPVLIKCTEPICARRCDDTRAHRAFLAPQQLVISSRPCTPRTYTSGLLMKASFVWLVVRLIEDSFFLTPAYELWTLLSNLIVSFFIFIHFCC